MIEIQCSSCHTRYRIDERVLPEDTPTFKCSRCGHVFTAEPRGARRPSVSTAHAEPAENESAAPKEDLGEPAPQTVQRKPSMLRSGATLNPQRRPRVGPAAAAASPKPAATESLRAPDPKPQVPPQRQPSSGAPRPQAPPPVSEAAVSEPAADLDRSFHRDGPEEPPSGENLSFDFDDSPLLDERVEPEPAASRHDDERWQVGDDQAEFAPHPSIHAAPPHAPEPAIASAEDLPLPEDDAEFYAERESVPRRAPYVPESARTHSTGVILGIFALVILLFGGGSVLICNAPMASAEFLNSLPGLTNRFAPPIVPARLVAIRDVSIARRTIKGATALVVTGKAVNVGNVPLHAVQFAATLQDGAHRAMAGATVYCGNNLASAMIGEMTPREIEFFQQLDPPKHFVLKPLDAAPFAIVFVNPPATAGDLSLAVAKATPASSDEVVAATPGT
jgi:predicted Zn finger-like uncharacterized protein